jgi:Zn finger protein HypA/HybF involved in hydrogenase expression
MHEQGLCDPVLKVVRDRLPAEWQNGHVLVRLRVSELSGLTEPALQTAFDHAHACHEGPEITLHLLDEGLLGNCRRCGRVVEVTAELTCASCGDTGVTLAAGETLLIEEISVISEAEPRPLPPPAQAEARWTGEGVPSGSYSVAHEH